MSEHSVASFFVHQAQLGQEVIGNLLYFPSAAIQLLVSQRQLSLTQQLLINRSVSRGSERGFRTKELRLRLGKSCKYEEVENKCGAWD